MPSPVVFKDDRGVLVRLTEHSPRLVELLLCEGNLRHHERKVAARLWHPDEVRGAMGVREAEEHPVAPLPTAMRPGLCCTGVRAMAWCGL